MLVSKKVSELGKYKTQSDDLSKQMIEKEKQIQTMQDKIDDLERMLDIKINEVEYYKGELDRAGIESNYEESVVSEGLERTDYYHLYLKEKDKVKALIEEQRRLLDLIETLKLELKKVQTNAVLKIGQK